MSGERWGSLVVDTHAAVWFLQRDERLSAAARTSMRNSLAGGDAIHVPSICLVELIYLAEKGRIPATASERVDGVLRDAESGFRLAPLDLRVAEAVGRVARDEIPDMPDRIIAATALVLGLPLVTRDGKIRSANIDTIW